MTIEQMIQAQELQRAIKECREFLAALNAADPAKDSTANLQLVATTGNGHITLRLAPAALAALRQAMAETLEQYENEFKQL